MSNNGKIIQFRRQMLMKKAVGTDEETPDEILQMLVEKGTITPTEAADLLNMNKEKKLKEIIDLGRIKYRSDGRAYIHVGRQLAKDMGRTSDAFYGQDRAKLIDNLYEVFFGMTEITLRDAYSMWQAYRIEIGTTSKTVLENKNDWKKYLENSKLADMKMKSIRPVDLKDYFLSITSGYQMTNRAFTNLRSVLNGIFTRCVELEIIDHNIVKDIDYTAIRKRFKPQKEKEDYTAAEKDAIIRYLRGCDGVYEQAIRLAFNIFLRISELVSLKYEDMKDGMLLVNRATRSVREASIDDEGNLKFDRTTYVTEDRIKGSTSSGFRKIPLTPEAIEIIEDMHRRYPENEYLFMFQGRQLTTLTFDRHLRKVCEKLDIPYRPSHQVRFSNASALYNNGVPLGELSRMMGHSNTATTLHYLRKQDLGVETKKKVVECLSVG